MPNFEEHCESTLRKLGCRFEKVHKWIDSPSRYMGKGHRVRRHDPYQTPQTAKELFSKHYPNHAHLIEDAVLDHIELDREEEIERRERKLEEKRIDRLSLELTLASIREERRIEASSNFLKALVVTVVSISVLYLSVVLDETHSSPLIVVFFFVSLGSLVTTLGFIADYLNTKPFTFIIFTLIELGVIIFLIWFPNILSVMVFIVFTLFFGVPTVIAVRNGLNMRRGDRKKLKSN